MSYATIKAEMANVFKTLQDLALKLQKAEEDERASVTALAGAVEGLYEIANALRATMKEDLVSLQSYVDVRAEYNSAQALMAGVQEAVGKQQMVRAAVRRLRDAAKDRYNELSGALNAAGAEVLKGPWKEQDNGS